MNWQPPQTAPRNGQVFIGDFGDIEPAATTWNGAMSDWCTVRMVVSKHKGVANDRNFENVYRSPNDLKRWARLD